MANIKFSQFTQKTTLGTVDFLVGYTGADNVQIDPADLLSDYSQGTGAAGQVTFFSATSTVTGDNDFYWDNTNKRLGIGTTTPVTKLQVDSTSDFSVALSKRGSTSSALKFTLSNPNTTTNTWKIEHDASENLKIFGYSADNLLISTNSTERMRITSSGNVGIGTTTPSAKLHVDGTLIATGVSQLGSGGSNVLLTSSSAGNVGIGISSPESKLHVGPSALLSGYTTTATALAISDVTNGAELILRGLSPRIFFDSTSGGHAEMYLDGYQFDILSGRPDVPGSSRFYINASDRDWETTKN
jgi:hypothetical protein